jgi:hypothetical protein
MQPLLFLPAYRSFYPSLTRTTAQPHRTQPPYCYELAAHATYTVPTLSAQLSMEGCPITPVHGRLPIFCRQQRRSVTAPRPRRVPTRPPRARTQPQERPLGAYTNLLAPRPPDRHHNLLHVPSPYFEATCHRYPLPNPPTTLCTRRTVATSPAAARSARRRPYNTCTSPF